MRFIGLICLAPWLAGCLATRPPTSAPVPVPAPVAAMPAPDRAGAAAPTVAKTKPPEPAPLKTSTPPAPRIAAVIAPPPPPARLIGLGATEVSKLLGVPARVRRERRARIWQYVTKDCVLDLFLYPAAGGHVVTHIESRAPKLGRTAAAATCVAGVVRRR